MTGQQHDDGAAGRLATRLRRWEQGWAGPEAPHRVVLAVSITAQDIADLRAVLRQLDEARKQRDFAIDANRNLIAASHRADERLAEAQWQSHTDLSMTIEYREERQKAYALIEKLNRRIAAVFDLGSDAIAAGHRVAGADILAALETRPTTKPPAAGSLRHDDETEGDGA